MISEHVSSRALARAAISRREPLPLPVRSLIAAIVLIVAGGVVAPSSLSLGAIMTMLPFFAVLGVASLGQHLVIQQRGVDLSVAGLMSLSAVIVSAFPSLTAGSVETVSYVCLALLVGLVVGIFNGIIITILGVPALVTTIGVNALLQGATMFASRGFAQQVPPPLGAFGLGSFLHIPHTIWVLGILTAVALFIIGRSAIGRRFIATSVNPSAAVAVGIPTRRYALAVYVISGLCYAAAGVPLASYVVSPTVFCGNPYLLATIAAVVVGGNAIGGGMRGSILATIIGAFFLTYLGQLVLSVGLGAWAQDVVQAAIVVGSAALPVFARHLAALRATPFGRIDAS